MPGECDAAMPDGFRPGANTDPQRDRLFTKGPSDVLDHATRETASGSQLGMDTTKRIPGEGFKRPWPPLIKMDAAVKAKVDKHFGGDAWTSAAGCERSQARAATRGIGQSQRDCVLQPKVARRELPWVTVRKWKTTPTGLWPKSFVRRCFHTHVQDRALNFIKPGPRRGAPRREWISKPPPDTGSHPPPRRVGASCRAGSASRLREIAATPCRRRRHRRDRGL